MPRFGGQAATDDGIMRVGWLTSVPGAVEIEMQCLPGSALPQELCARGYDLVDDGETERILNGGIGKVKRFAFQHTLTNLRPPVTERR
jgi:hypothetical protein